jgi:hypothetical protein
VVLLQHIFQMAHMVVALVWVSLGLVQRVYMAEGGEVFIQADRLWADQAQ